MKNKEYFQFVKLSSAAVQFFYVLCMQTEEITIGELAKITGLEHSVTSRIINALSEERREGLAGYGLVEVYVDIMDRRKRLINLTTKGEQLKNKLYRIMISEEKKE